MSRWWDLFPGEEPEDLCLDCLTINVVQDGPFPPEIVTPCVYHGPHGEHDLSARVEGNASGWYCNTCECWLKDD